MKKIGLVLLLVSNFTFAQIKKGDHVPDFDFEMVNTSKKTIKLSSLKGKLVWLEFWATWCGACIEAMPHVVALQQKYKDQLQVIAVGNEPVERIAQFLKVKPIDLSFAVDTAELLKKYFPYRLIPHSVLIGADGKLVSYSNTEQITVKVIDSLLKGQQVHLEDKKDNFSTDYVRDYFYADDKIKHRVLWQAQIKGAGGMLFSHFDNPAFSGRRLTFINVSLSSIFREAFGDFPYGRTIDSLGTLAEGVFCLDIIVDKKSKLHETLKRALAEKYKVDAKIQKQTKEVFVLSIVDPPKFAQVKRNTDGSRSYFARHGAIDQKGITLADFATFLESFGSLRKLVIDESGNTELLDLKFNFQPENKDILLKILADMGLGLTPAIRTVDVLSLKHQ